MSRAWIPSREGVHVIEEAVPSPEPHEVVIAVEAAQLSRAQPHRHSAVPGQAAVGRVVAAGEQALALLDQRVLVGAMDPCGQCEVCRRGGGTVCPHARHRGSDARGTLAERITVAAKWVVPLGGELGLDGAANAASASAVRDELAGLPGVELPQRPESGQPTPGPSKPGKAAKPPPKLPADLGALAAIAGDAALAYTAYARSDLAAREPVVLLGCAPVTRFLVDVLLAKGLAPVVLLERQLDEHGFDRSDRAWRAWLDERKVRKVEHDDQTDLDELRAEIYAALAERGAEAAAAASPAAAPSEHNAGEATAGRPWKLIASAPRHVWLATRLAGPRAVVTAIVPPVLRDGPGARAQLDEQQLAHSPDHLLHSMMVRTELDATNDADDFARGVEIDPSAWGREVSMISVTAASPELVLETAALVARGQLDLDEGVAVVDLGDLAPESIEALGASRALVVRVPPARG